MVEQWEARGPDEFGDFTISAQGEELAKCVVVQNGFRKPEETKAIAERLIKAVNNHDALVKALTDAQRIIERDFPNGQLAIDIRTALINARVGGSQEPEQRS